MLSNIKLFILEQTGASDILECEVVQELWSGFGQIIRVQLIGAPMASVIVKNIDLRNSKEHPRGWDTNASFKRKKFSYQVEQNWYENYSKQSDSSIRVAKHLGSVTGEHNSMILLEDLDASGFSIRKSSLNIEETKTCIQWLANFHGRFMGREPEGLWDVGTYWHLATRSDEFKAMKDSELKRKAFKLDELLNGCKFKTIVHGDAKVANFCFSKNVSKVAAVDFQYVGGGCGMKDVVYLMGSCLSSSECQEYVNELIRFYFECLKSALAKNGNQLDFKLLEVEWRFMFKIAWADFSRFLQGWMPSNSKLNSFDKQIVRRALESA